VAFFICFGNDFFRFWLGEGFDTSYYATVIVLIPCLFHLTQTIAEELIYAKNLVKYRALINVVTSVLCVIFISLLAPKYGAIGASIGVALGFIGGYTIIANIIYSKKLDINVMLFFKECHAKIGIPLIGTIMIGFLFQKFIAIENFFNFFMTGMLWVIIYGIVMWFFALNINEKTIVLNPVRRLIGK